MKSLIRSPFTFEKPLSFYIDRIFENDYDWFCPQKTNGQVNISEGKDGYTIEVTARGFQRKN